MKNYAISVVTPFHNVAPGYFKKCCESMFAQTIGFENVEWIVVVHNSDKQYLDNVNEMLGGYENVKIIVLNDDKKTPSSPRNCGIEHATAPYIGFLDADDSYTPHCLQKVLSYTEKNNTQITWFRREYELESDKNKPITEVVLWDQTQEEIIITKDNWDDEKMFSGVCGMVTSRIYDRCFIESNNIWFDDSVPFAEDYLFNLVCYGHADRICYLPQMIGYHYYINNSSLVQNSSKSAETLIEYAKGYKKVFDAGLSYGFSMNAIISSLCCVLARFMIASDDLTLDDRREIRDILAPYLENIKPLRVSKLYPEKAVRERYDFPRAVILDPENYSGNGGGDTLIAVDVKTSQNLSPYQLVLRDILYRNHDTDIGRRYGFDELLTLSGYQKRVPESYYDMYEPLLRLQTNIGESGIITADPIKNYMFFLGRMSNPKLVPCTDKQLEPLERMMIEEATGKKTFIMLESFPQKHRFNDNSFVNTPYGAILSGVFESNELSAYAKRNLFTSPYEVMFPTEVVDFTYIRLLFALSERFLDRIFAPNTWEVWNTFRFLENNWRNLCADIESGKPDHFNQAISDELRAAVEDRLISDPGRANELMGIFKQGFDTPVVPKIWRKLSNVTAFGGGSFSIYTENISRYLGNIKHCNGSFIEFSALLGKETEKKGMYELGTENAFIELVPADSDGDAVLAPNAEPGKLYYPLISTYSGLYRYRLSDVICVAEIKNNVPIFSYEYNSDQTITICGVSITESDILESVTALGKEAGVSVADYAYMENEKGDGIVLLIETTVDDVSGYDVGKLSETVDKRLEERVVLYRDAAASGKLQKAQVVFVEPESQLFYRDVLMYRLKFPHDFIKPTRFINDPVSERFFRSRIIR